MVNTPLMLSVPDSRTFPTMGEEGAVENFRLGV
jgi:hypothetical protein